MVLYIVYNNIIWACIIAAVIGAGAATLVFHLKGGKKGEAKEFSAKNALKIREAGIAAPERAYILMIKYL